MNNNVMRIHPAFLLTGIALMCASCTPPPKGIVAECEPIPAAKLKDVNSLLISGNFGLSGNRMTDDPHLVLPVLAALEHGMVNDPQAEATRRMHGHTNGVIMLEYRKAGQNGRNIRPISFDALEFSPPRYRKEFVDAVTAAYRGGMDIATFETTHPGSASEKKSK